MRETRGPYINDEQLTTIRAGYEINCKNPYSQQPSVLLVLLSDGAHQEAGSSPIKVESNNNTWTLFI